MKPLVSIIIPVYNVESYLRQCVDSVLAQTYTDFELLLINDGSTDRSGSICDEYAAKDSRVSVFHKKNGGVSSARNMGLDNAKGEWITFVDSDDWVDEDYLESFTSDFGKYEMIFQGFTIDGKDVKRAVHIYQSILANSDKIDLIEKLNIIYNGYCFGIFFNNTVINNNSLRFREDIQKCEDLIFVLHYLYIADKVRAMDQAGYHYNTQVQNSLSKKIQTEDTVLGVLDELFTILHEQLLLKKLNNYPNIREGILYNFNVGIRDLFKQSPSKKDKINYLKKIKKPQYSFFLKNTGISFKMNILHSLLIYRFFKVYVMLLK